MAAIQEMWVIKIFHSRNRIDVYYRKDSASAEGLYQMNKGMFPKARVTKRLSKVKMEEE